MHTANIKIVKLEQKYWCQNNLMRKSLPWVTADTFDVSISSIHDSMASFHNILRIVILCFVNFFPCDLFFSSLGIIGI